MSYCKALTILACSFLPVLGFAEDTTKFIDWVQLEKQQKIQSIAHDDLSPPPLEEFERPQAVKIGANQFVLASVRCQQKLCAPYVALLEGTPTNVKINKLVNLPVPKSILKKTEHYHVLPTLVTNLQENGEKNVLVRYEVMTYPRDEEGSLFYTYLAILSLKDLSTRLIVENNRTGHGSIDLDCDSKWRRANQNDDGTADLLMIRTCMMKRCKDIPSRVGCKSETEVFGFIWNPQTKKYEQDVSFSGKFISLPSPILQEK